LGDRLWQNDADHFEDASMPSLVLDIALPAERFLAVYQGRANRVLLYSRDGRKVSLPAHHLRPFLRRDGIHGVFELEFSAAGELLDLRQLQ
jgi:hypothetical protein